MDRVISRICAAFEYAFIVLPTTIGAFASWPIFISADHPGESLATHLAFNSMMVTAPFSCVAAGTMLAALVFSNSTSLGPVPWILWIGTAIGTIVTLIGLSAFGFQTLYPALSVGTPASHFAIFTAGAPMLLPVAHILLLKPSVALPTGKG